MKNWLIIGAGISGLGAAQLLRKKGDFVRVSEKSHLSPDKKKAWLELGVECLDDGHELAHLSGISNILLSPGIPANHPLLIAAKNIGLPMISEIDLALENYRGHVIAVTGTNGKSTTCAMIHHLLDRLGLKSAIAGNFGDPPSAILARSTLPPYLVLELSSYQLEQSHKIHPAVAVFTSFSYDHIARHGSMEAYFRTKWRVFENSHSHQLAILPSEIERLRQDQGLTLSCDRTVVSVDLVESLIPPGKGPREEHNQLNATFAMLAVGRLTGRSPASLLPLLDDFRGLPHRCELVGTISHMEVINDSKSTNVESSLVALTSCPSPVILMMGGQGKGEPYGPLLDKKAKIAVLVTFGPTGVTIARELEGHFPIYQFETLKAALSGISGILKRHQHPILFSPGCASFDEFKNYEHRGEVFREAMILLCDRSPSRDPSC